MKLSLTLPSLFPDALAIAVGNIEATTWDVDYEIVAVSPFEVSGPRIRWVREETPAGNCHAHRMGFEASAGDVVVALSDDVRLVDGWATTYLQNFLASEQRNPQLCLGLRAGNVLGTVFGIYYPYFPGARRSTIEAAGGYFSDEFRARFGDPDLALRVWTMGGRCEFTTQSLIAFDDRRSPEENARTHKDSALDRDTATFLAKWAPVYGEGWDTSHLRGFNLDMPLAAYMVLGRDNTVHFNTPAFAVLMDNVRVNYWVVTHDMR